MCHTITLITYNLNNYLFTITIPNGFDITTSLLHFFMLHVKLQLIYVSFSV